MIVVTDNWLEPRDEFDDGYTFDVMNSYISILDFYRGVFSSLVSNTLLYYPFFPEKNTFKSLKPIYFSLNSLMFGLGYHLGEESKDDGMSSIYVPQLAIDDIVEAARAINSSKIMEDPLKSMHFFGELVNSCFVETRNFYLKAMTMCSIIEYIVARNPDTGKFNVDESINKQFQMKTSLLINRYDENFALDETAKFLKVAYELRSSVAHGSFDGVDKILKKFGDSISEFDHKLHGISRACFKAFIQLPEYANFIKKS